MDPPRREDSERRGSSQHVCPRCLDVCRAEEDGRDGTNCGNRAALRRRSGWKWAADPCSVPGRPSLPPSARLSRWPDYFSLFLLRPPACPLSRLCPCLSSYFSRQAVLAAAAGLLVSKLSSCSLSSTGTDCKPETKSRRPTTQTCRRPGPEDPP